MAQFRAVLSSLWASFSRWFTALSTRNKVITIVAGIIVLGILINVTNHSSSTASSPSPSVASTVKATATKRSTGSTVAAATATAIPVTLKVDLFNVVIGQYVQLGFTTNSGATVTATVRHDCDGTIDTLLPSSKVAGSDGVVKWTYKSTATCTGNVHLIVSSVINGNGPKIEQDTQSTQ